MPPDPEHGEDDEALVLQLPLHLRERVLSMPNPEPLTLFDNVYVDGSAELDEQRAQFGNYLASFEGSAH